MGLLFQSKIWLALYIFWNTVPCFWISFFEHDNEHWSLMLQIVIALIKQSSFQVEATLNSIRVFELFRSLAIQTRQKSPFWCLTQFVRAESRRVNLFEFSWEELSFWCLRRFVPPNNHWLHNSGRQSSLPSKSPSSKAYKQYLRIRTMVRLAPRGFKII